MAKAKKLPSGSWRCRVYDYTDENGKKYYRSFTSNDPSPKGKREAEYAAAEFAANKKENLKSGNKYSSTVLEQAMNDYCNLKNNVLSPSTIRGYKQMIRTNYNDIKILPLSEVTNDAIQRWVNSFASNHSPKTTRNAYGLLTAVMEAYMPEISIKVTLPQKTVKNLYVPSDSDIKTILEYFKENDNDMELAVYLAAFGTLRRSEICGLYTDDVKANIIYVHRAIVDAGNSEWVLKDTTKNTSSTRHVEMPEYVIKKFPKSGKIVSLNPDQITHRFTTALKKLGIIHFRFHDLRHYAASIMHAIGVPDQYIMQRGGWASDKTLKSIYRGTIEDYERKYTDLTLSHFENI